TAYLGIAAQDAPRRWKKPKTYGNERESPTWPTSPDSGNSTPGPLDHIQIVSTEQRWTGIPAADRFLYSGLVNERTTDRPRRNHGQNESSRRRSGGPAERRHHHLVRRARRRHQPAVFRPAQERRLQACAGPPRGRRLA